MSLHGLCTSADLASDQIVRLQGSYPRKGCLLRLEVADARSL